MRSVLPFLAALDPRLWLLIGGGSVLVVAMLSHALSRPAALSRFVRGLGIPKKHRPSIETALVNAPYRPLAFRTGSPQPWLNVGLALAAAEAWSAAQLWFQAAPQSRDGNPWAQLRIVALSFGEKPLPAVMAGHSDHRITVLPLVPVRLARGLRVWLNAKSGERLEARVRDGGDGGRAAFVHLATGAAADHRRQREDVRVATALSAPLYPDTTTIQALRAARDSGRASDLARLTSRLREELGGHPPLTVAVEDLSIGGARFRSESKLFEARARGWIWLPEVPEARLGDALLLFEVLGFQGEDPCQPRVRFLRLTAADKSANRVRVGYWERLSAGRA